MKLVDKLFNFVIVVQVFIFLIFIVENVNNLSEITINIPYSDESQEINLYHLIGGIIGVMAIVILLSISIFGAGLNSQGSRLVGKILGIAILLILLGLGNNYYLASLGWVATFVNTFVGIIYALKLIDMLMEDKKTIE